jgi:hypothetical protein
MKKVVASGVGLLFLASSSLAAEAYLKCKWVAEKKTEGRTFEGREFAFPVEVEKGFFYYLENGMTEKQKRILAATGKSFNPPPQEVSIFCEVEMNCGRLDRGNRCPDNQGT